MSFPAQMQCLCTQAAACVMKSPVATSDEMQLQLQQVRSVVAWGT